MAGDGSDRGADARRPAGDAGGYDVTFLDSDGPTTVVLSVPPPPPSPHGAIALAMVGCMLAFVLGVLFGILVAPGDTPPAHLGDPQPAADHGDPATGHDATGHGTDQAPTTAPDGGHSAGHDATGSGTEGGAHSAPAGEAPAGEGHGTTPGTQAPAPSDPSSHSGTPAQEHATTTAPAAHSGGH